MNSSYYTLAHAVHVYVNVKELFVVVLNNTSGFNFLLTGSTKIRNCCTHGCVQYCVTESVCEDWAEKL